MTFVDTNYFVRFLVNRESEQGIEAKRMFDKAAGEEIELFSSNVVFFEIYWLMKSFYGQKKEALVTVLRNVLALSFVKWENGKLLAKSVEMMKKVNYDLEDAYNLAFARDKKAGRMASFDKKLQRVWKSKE